MGKTRFCMALAAAAALGNGMAHAKGTTYTYTAIVIPGSVQVVPASINDAGTVLGAWYDETYTEHGFIFQNGTVTSFDEPNAANGTLPSVIDASGNIVGSYYDASYVEHGFTYVPSTGVFTTVDMPGANGTGLAGIDSKGVLYGVASGSGNQQVVFSYAKGKFTTLPFTGSPAVSAVSDKGAIVGTDYSAFPFTAFLYEKGVETTLPLTAPGGAAAIGVNSKGDVVGETAGSSYVETGYIYAKGIATPVSVSGAATTILNAINDSGVAVGVGYDQYFDVLGSFSYKKGKITMISEPNGTETAASKINASGQVIGSYYDNTYGSAGFVATPN